MTVSLALIDAKALYEKVASLRGGIAPPWVYLRPSDQQFWTLVADAARTLADMHYHRQLSPTPEVCVDVAETTLTKIANAVCDELADRLFPSRSNDC